MKMIILIGPSRGQGRRSQSTKSRIHKIQANGFRKTVMGGVGDNLKGTTFFGAGVRVPEVGAPGFSASAERGLAVGAMLDR
jgi:hypothetical protein